MRDARDGAPLNRNGGHMDKQTLKLIICTIFLCVCVSSFFLGGREKQYEGKKNFTAFFSLFSPLTKKQTQKKTLVCQKSELLFCNFNVKFIGSDPLTCFELQGGFHCTHCSRNHTTKEIKCPVEK